MAKETTKIVRLKTRLAKKPTPPAKAAKKTSRPRDPVKTERNRIIKSMTESLRAMLPQVLKETGWPTEGSLHGVIGGKAAEFMDLHHAQIHSADGYASLYMKGFKGAMKAPGAFTHRDNYDRIKGSAAAREYFMLFLKRSYLK